MAEPHQIKKDLRLEYKRLTSLNEIIIIEPTSEQDSAVDDTAPAALPINRLVVSVLAITALSNSAYAIMAPFVPFEFEKKQIDQGWIGSIFSIYSVAVVMCSPMVGKMISFVGRRNLLIVGMVLMGASFVVFGFLTELRSNRAFITAVLLNRFLQGFASSLIQTTMYSISTNFFPGHKGAMVGYIEAVTGVGLILGPLIGSVLYSIGGYLFIFYAFGSMFLLFSFFIKTIFDDRIDKIYTAMSEHENESTHSRAEWANLQGDDFARQETPNDINIGQCLFSDDDSFSAPLQVETNTSAEDQETSSLEPFEVHFTIGTFELLAYPRFVFGCLSASLGYFLYGFMEPVLAFRAHEFDLSPVQIGMFFMIMPTFYILTSIYVPKVPSSVEKRAVLISACFLSFFSNLFVGPSQVFGFPNSIWMLALGQVLRGIIDPFILVPALPEMIETALPYYPESCEGQINDISSGLFNMFLGLGQIVGPLFGAQMTQSYGFRTCSDSAAVICLAFSMLYYLCCDGNEAFRSSLRRAPRSKRISKQKQTQQINPQNEDLPQSTPPTPQNFVNSTGSEEVKIRINYQELSVTDHYSRLNRSLIEPRLKLMDEDAVFLSSSD